MNTKLQTVYPTIVIPLLKSNANRIAISNTSVTKIPTIVALIFIDSNRFRKILPDNNIHLNTYNSLQHTHLWS